MTAKETSQEVRKVLKEKFPGVKFSVRTRHGDEVRVVWLDGPTESAVHGAIGHMKAGNFNGMIDLYEYDRNSKYDNRWLTITRGMSKDVWEKAVAEYREKWGDDIAQVTYFEDSTVKGAKYISVRGAFTFNERPGTLIWRIAREIEG